MRILHTADWHLNATLGRVSLAPFLLAALEHIASLLEEHQVDVLVVAGDIFGAESSPDAVEIAARKIARILFSFFWRGGTMMVVAGEHDRDQAFTTLSRVLGKVKYFPSGHLHFAKRPKVVRISEPLTDGEHRIVQFVLLPYPTSSRYLVSNEHEDKSPKEQQNALEQTFLQKLQALRDEEIDSQIPAVLVSPVAVGNEASSGENGIVLSPQEGLTNWSYTACGYSHTPREVVPGVPHARYAGSIARLASNERDEHKSVVIFDLDPMGVARDLRVLPLPVATFYDVEINDAATEIPMLQSRYPKAAQALVDYTLHYHSGTHDLAILLAEIDRIFPLWYRRTLHDLAKVSTPSTAFTVVRNYLVERFKEHPERDTLLALADELWAEDESREWER